MVYMSWWNWSSSLESRWVCLAPSLFPLERVQQVREARNKFAEVEVAAAVVVVAVVVEVSLEKEGPTLVAPRTRQETLVQK
jgi:hypothetical protein